MNAAAVLKWIALPSLTTCLACHSPNNKPNGTAGPKPIMIKPKDLQQDFTTWYNYTYYNIDLAQDFQPFNEQGLKLSKTAFLNQLATGNYIAFKENDNDSLPCYKLYPLTDTSNGIRTIVQQMAVHELFNHSLEGKELPPYHFTDLQGNVYSPQNTKGHILVLKCWFIHCTACIREFPQLNALVTQYKDRKDISFVSLAIDPKQKLDSFLKTKDFRFASVPGQEKYLLGQLKVNTFPTHILVGKNGKIVSVVDRVEDLSVALEKEAAK